MNDSGIQTALIVTNENNLTDSIAISNAGAKSTPITTKIKEKEWSMAGMIELMRAMSDDIKHSTVCYPFL